MLELTVDQMRNYILKIYPGGTINGKPLETISEAQVQAVFLSLMKPKTPKQIKGQMSLFD